MVPIKMMGACPRWCGDPIHITSPGASLILRGVLFPATQKHNEDGRADSVGGLQKWRLEKTIKNDNRRSLLPQIGIYHIPWECNIFLFLTFQRRCACQKISPNKMPICETKSEGTVLFRWFFSRIFTYTSLQHSIITFTEFYAHTLIYRYFLHIYAHR